MADGLSFTVPRLYTNAGTPNVAPTVASTSEGGAPSETGMTSSYDTVSITKYSGLNRVSFELLERSAPAFNELLMAELRKAYEKATDNALIAAFTANGTAATGVAATAAGAGESSHPRPTALLELATTAAGTRVVAARLGFVAGLAGDGNAPLLGQCLHSQLLALVERVLLTLCGGKPVVQTDDFLVDQFSLEVMQLELRSLLDEIGVVLRHLVETDELRTIEVQAVHLALALDNDEAICTTIFDSALRARFDG